MASAKRIIEKRNDELLLSKRHKWPLIEQECTFPPPTALFPREILEPKFLEFIRLYASSKQAADGATAFFSFLLKQVKP